MMSDSLVPKPSKEPAQTIVGRPPDSWLDRLFWFATLGFLLVMLVSVFVAGLLTQTTPRPTVIEAAPCPTPEIGE